MAPPYEPRGSGSTRTSAHLMAFEAVAGLADGAGRSADPPARHDLPERIEDEGAPFDLAMRDVQRPPAAAAPAPARPEQYIQIEHPTAPAAPAATPEAGFQIFQKIKQDGRVEWRAHDNGGVGEASRGRPQRGRSEDRRAGLDRQSGGRQCLDRAAKDSGWGSEASMPPVRSQSDRIKMRGHGRRYRPVPETIPSAEQAGLRGPISRNRPPRIVDRTAPKGVLTTISCISAAWQPGAAPFDSPKFAVKSGRNDTKKA